MVDKLDFTFEFYSEVSLPYSKTDLRADAERELRELAAEHDDIIGASVAIEELTGSATPHRYQVRIVVYSRPEYIAGVEKGQSPKVALRQALDVVERQVREQRERLRTRWKQP